MRACGLRSFAYRRYPPIHIAAPPGPRPAVPEAIGPEENALLPHDEHAPAHPRLPESLPLRPDRRPAEQPAGAARASFLAPVRLRRPKRPAAARAETIQDGARQAAPGPGSQSLVAPAPAVPEPPRTMMAQSSPNPAWAPRPAAGSGDHPVTAPRAYQAGTPSRSTTQVLPPAPPRRFALLDEVSAEAAVPQVEARPGRAAPESAQETPGPARPRPRLRLHTRSGGAA